MQALDNDIKQVGGVWLPAHETHLVEWMKNKNQVVDGKLTYQLDKQRAAMEWVKNWRTAIDVGGHCGLWSMNLAKLFMHVEAFEPVALHRKCFKLNVGWTANGTEVALNACALGDHQSDFTKVSIHTADTSSGDSWVNGEGDILMRCLDGFPFPGLTGKDIDFMKLDCEGYELFVLRGGEELLKRCHPCVIVEQKPGRAQKFGLPETGAVAYLQSLGAVLRREMAGDFILSWDD